MKSFSLFLLLCCFLWIDTLHAQQVEAGYFTGKLFVKIYTAQDLEFPTWHEGQPKPNFSELPEVAALIDRYQVTALFKPFRTPAAPLQHIYELHFTDQAHCQDLIDAWQVLPYIEYAERIPAYSIDYTPNDLSFFQWHLSKVQAQGAWDISTGNRQVIIAIVDDAVRMDHEDLNAQIWTNPGEIPGDSIDNDGNGWIDDIHGYDIAEGDNDPNPPAAHVSNGTFSHGTHVAGIAAATTDNSTGISSMGFDLAIMPVKVKEDCTYTNNLLQATFGGVDYAISSGADVVNMSFGGSGHSSSFDYLLQVGTDSGMVFVASAGNTGSYSIQYPAGYANAISVASTGFNDELSGFSTYHPYVDVSAPGSNIYSCTAGSPTSYGFMSGTSMSAPLVSGLMGLLCAIDSTATPQHLRHCLESTTDNIDAENPSTLGNFGTGRINAYQAASCLAFPVSIAPSLTQGFVLGNPSPQPAHTNVRLSARFPTEGHLRLRLTNLMGQELATLHDSPVTASTFETDWTPSLPLAPGLYLLVWDFEGQHQVQRLNWVR